MKWCVTGSSGFIGSHLVEELKKRGHDVKGCDPKAGVELNDDVRTITSDYLKGVDICAHLGAASGSLHFDPKVMEESIDINCRGTVHLLKMCKEAGVKKIVFASTASSYVGGKVPHKETLPLELPNFYAATKQFGESSLKLYKELYGLDCVILRFASVYGDNEESKGPLANVVSQFIWKMMKGEAPDLWGTGTQTRDLVFVSDVVDACILAGEKNLRSGGIFNVGTGVETSFIDIITKINTELGTKIDYTLSHPTNQNVQRAFCSRQLMDMTKLAKIGWKARVGVDEGIRRIVQNIRARG